MTRDEKITAVVCSSRGTTTADVAVLFGLSDSSMGAILRRLCSEGRIAKTAPLGPTLRWCAPADRAELVAQARKEMKARKLKQHAERTRTRRERDKEAKAAQRQDESGEADGWPVVHRLIAAASAPTIKRPMLSCVWDLAR